MPDVDLLHLFRLEKEFLAKSTVICKTVGEEIAENIEENLYELTELGIDYAKMWRDMQSQTKEAKKLLKK